MSDLLDDPTPGQNLPEFSVSELSGAVKKTLESQFGRIRVRGEIGRVVRARSGHYYYDVKDDRNVLACTTWKGQVSGLGVMPEEGLEVVATGRLTGYGAQSKYNLNVDDLVVAGQGALMALLEKRKKALEAEGLFAPERKRPLPYLPQIIGVVTSPTGAVIRDILHRLRDRFPRKVLIWPVAVQGQNCAPEVARAIAGFNALTPGGALPRPDVIIVARGGGSIEDLWGFNEEAVARAAAASEIPLISAVGHETDTTLIDYVSDRRAPTPTAAAEIAVPVRVDLLATTDAYGARVTRALAQGLDRRGQRLRDLSRSLPRAESLLETPRQRLDQAGVALSNALTRGIQVRRLALSERSAAVRPATIARHVAGKSDRFARLSERLRPDLVQRDHARKADAVERLSRRLALAGQVRTERLRARLTNADRMLASLGYEATLERGYAVVRSDDVLITSAKGASEAVNLEIQFADGRVQVGAGTVPAPTPRPAPKRAAKKGDPDQGTLF
ncbi:MAG: exodeoxyribonuclease VII large subunit [Paracoccaceae bacterium]